ncbi:MAG: hypothetical protein FWD87_03985 [Spirochaetaceae bacterium]|nr:hypothetical protein [Spirochaetaceae bacterium]
MVKKILKILFLLFFISVVCLAQDAQEKNSSFWEGIARPAVFGKPFWADMHSTLIRIEIAYATNSPDYDWGNFNTSYRPYIFTNLGVDIPLWSGNFADGKYGLSITLPFMLDIWYDRFEWVTSPVINTAYRFGAPDVNFIYRLDSPVLVFPHFNIYNWALKLSLLKHESTHIGDELTIHRMHENLDIIRVDVLSNYFELIFSINDPDGQTRLNHGFRFGFLFNYNFRDGWYTVLESEANPELFGPSRFPFELYMQYQFQSPLFSRGFQMIASLEYRLRERYNYPFLYSGAINDSLQVKHKNTSLVNCFNILIGARYDNQKRNYFSKIGIGVRYYFGINPYGQFRSMPRYRQLGLVAIFE